MEDRTLGAGSGKPARLGQDHSFTANTDDVVDQV